MTSHLTLGDETKPSSGARLRLLCVPLLLLALATAGGAFAAPRPVLGANVDLTFLDPAARAETLDRLAAAGVTSIRIPLDWNKVEPRPGAFTWKAFDAAVASAQARGMDVVMVLGPCADWAVNPAWQVPRDQRSNSLPKSPSLWRKYVKAAVTHFRKSVHCWQVREQPNGRNFRGARSEYLALLDSAAREIRTLDPQSRVIVPEAGSLDIGGVDRFLSSASAGSAQVLGVYLGTDPSREMLPWAVLANEIVPSRNTGAKPIWVLGLDSGAPAASCQTDYLLSWAFGAERCYLPAAAVDQEWTRPLLELEYVGFASPAPGAWVLFFSGSGGALAIAWGPAGTAICPPTIPVSTAGAQADGSAAAAMPSAPAALPIGPRPAAIPAAGWSARPGPPTRTDVLASRGCADLSAVPLVYMDLSMPDHPEFGLANRSMRSLAGGACVEEARQGRTCVRTQLSSQVELDNPWVYFDVDDSWLYFDRGRSKVTITVECEGSYVGARKLGFNILYDSTTGYRFTPWRWVEPGQQWRSYRVELDDVNFANRDGWDFRINTKGSVQDMWVSAVALERRELSAGD